jgi:hypothetical protein
MGFSELKFEELYHKLKDILTNRPATCDELCMEINQFSKENILHLLKWLTDNGQIFKDEHDKFIWIY